MLGRRTLLKRLGALGMVAVLPPTLVAPELWERTRTYFIGGLAVVDDTARLQSFLNAGGGVVPYEWGELVIRGPIHMPAYSRLIGARIYSPDPRGKGLVLDGHDWEIRYSQVRSNGKYGICVLPSVHDASIMGNIVHCPLDRRN